MTKGADSGSETPGYISCRSTSRNVTTRFAHGAQPKPHGSNQLRRLSISANKLPTARHTHTQHYRSVTATPSPSFSQLRSAVSTRQRFFFSQPTAYPKNSLSFITSTCTAQSLQRVLPILHNHFNVYPFYSTATSCTASLVQSLQRVLPLLHNHFVYSLYCTIT